MSRRASGVVTPRDARLFSYLFEHKVALSRQIARDIFPGRSLSGVYRRLAKLRQREWLSAQAVWYENQPKVSFHLTMKAFSTFFHGDDLNRIQLKSDCPHHDVTLLDIAYRLRSVTMVKAWHTENSLQSDGHLKDELKPFAEVRSDAVLQMEMPNGTRYWIPLEYEASAKTRERWSDKLRQYFRISHCPAVLYICETSQIQKRLMNVVSEIESIMGDKLFCTQSDDVLSAAKPIHFINAKGKILVMS